jgi:hypothetical protein
MKKRVFGPIVAVRELREVTSSRKIIIKIAKPRKEKTGDWVCAYSLAGSGKHEIQYAYGIDAFQAIFMALEGIRGMLDDSTICLKWSGGEAGDTGFPRMIPGFFGLQFSQKLDRMIEKEVIRFSRAAEKRANR